MRTRRRETTGGDRHYFAKSSELITSLRGLNHCLNGTIYDERHAQRSEAEEINIGDQENTVN